MADQPSVAPQPALPGRKWYVVAAAVFVLGWVVFGLFLFTQLSGLTSGLHQVVVPGTADLKLEQLGTYTVFHERVSVVNGQYFASGQPISGLQVSVAALPSGASVPVTAPGASTSYSLGGREGVSILTFVITEPGVYRLSAAYADRRDTPRVVLAVGQGVGTRILTTVLGGVGIAFGSSALALVIAVITFLKRRRRGEARAKP